MAWKNIFIPNITTEISSENLESNDFVNLGNSYDIVSVNDLITLNTESVIYEKGTFKITVYATTTQGAYYEPYYPNYKVYCDNTLVASTQGFDCDIVGLALGFDYSSKKAKLRTVQRRYSTYPPTPSSTRFSIKETSWSDSVQQTIYNTLVDVGLIVLSGGAGSGYIGNSLVSNKKMVGYNVPTSSAESTKTESVNEASETPVANKPKIGNGFARIKLLRATSDISFFTSSLSSDLMVEDWDIANYKESLEYGNPTMQPTMYSEFFLTEWNFNIGNQWAPSTTISNGELVRSGRGDNRPDAVFWIPVNRINKTIIKITADYKVTDQRHWGSGFDRIGFWVGYVDSNNEWHSVSLGNKYPDDENWHTGGEWVYNGSPIPYIDYIGIEGGDGIYHAKNIVLTVG